MTLTVFFDLGNPGGDDDATFNPTAWISHDAGVFDLIAVTAVMTGQPPFPGNTPIEDQLYFTGITANTGKGWIEYIFKNVSGTPLQQMAATEFFPQDVVSSGAQDKYNQGIATTGSGPLAVALNSLLAKHDNRASLLGLLTVMGLLLMTFRLLRQHRQNHL